MNPITDWMNRNPALARLAALPRPVLLGLGAAIVALLVVATLWMREPEYRALFSNVEARDGGAIVSVLNQRNVPYKFADNGATILVPADQVYALRLQLAEQGLPRGGSVGFELLDEPKFGASQFSEQITYQRALEGELARSIEALQPVKSARVHLAIPRQSLFVRDREAPTASVLLTLYPSRTLSESQVSAIAWLVSSSVPKLNAESVSIVDQDGHLMSSPGGEAGMDSTRRNFINDVEQRTTQRILTLLNPIVGPGNVRAQVSATVDFSQREQTSEVYRPNETPGTAAIRSKQTSDSAQNGMLPPTGVPGALSNEPPANATAPIQTAAANQATQAPAAAGTQSPPAQTSGTGTVNGAPGSARQGQGSVRNDATVNYEVDRTISHVKHELGSLQRLSVAVVVNYRDKDGEPAPLDSAEMDDINALVKQAMGYSADRGDTLSVVNSAFTDQEPKFKPWENPEYRGLALQVLKVLLILAVLFFLWRSVVRPIVQGFANAQVERAKNEAHLETMREQRRQDELRASEMNRYEENLDTARQLAQRDPRAVAMVLRSWMDPKNAKS
ncbi:flagellar basal-body MS-ring/collar protein FliF [Castellaniella denitrificans]|uniref:Flagellar M-ring protein n=1 Tax=Castellaniella denitrificans TaxID=56119 RepID=A0ABT4M6A8_9BURK|nr:flagellar basal-body MS-ring/collar protein FliF [Castellaniella denitrificans]MCZ4330629.1 flagellar basal-body MS-ring/collar protein FliF [Castellaniella denitrificans]